MRPAGNCHSAVDVRTGWYRRLALLLAWLCLGPLQAQAPVRSEITVRLGFSARTLAGGNHADIAAAMKAWILTIAQEQHLDLETDAQVFDTVEEMETALRQERIDGFDVATDDFLTLEKVAPLADLFVSMVSGRITEQYVLLVQRDSPARELKDLRGGNLVLLDHPRAALAPHWLEVELARHRLPPLARFFGKVGEAHKPALAIMPVFFRQADAALVTRSGFEVAAELNPQLGERLRVLAQSPELIPTVGAFRASAVSGAVDLYRREALASNQSQGGRLFLNLLQSDGVVEIRRADLAGTLALLAEYAKLCREPGAGEGIRTPDLRFTKPY
jgi:phosphonate transport system substrate-binding protein